MSRFQRISSQHLPVLQATLEQYVDEATGARHVHLATDREELAFLVGFPTVPATSDGRAHILEHVVLCGSERYPVSDPFFAMLRRSTATFMNAMTYADRTVYPFASTDRADYFNLLDVYLDAAFFPKLDYLSFRQEGWRHALEDGKLTYQGVVFNEMKGAFDDPMRALHQGINKILLAGTTYEVESGGDPLEIPDLSYDELKAFHARHYHVSQAMFMSAGKIEAVEIQRRIEERVLSRMQGRASPFLPGLAADWDVARLADVLIPSQGDVAADFGLQMAWRLGESGDASQLQRARLLTMALIGDASAPIRRAMESAGFGRVSQMNGISAESRQIVMHLGMAGLTEAQTEAASACIRGALATAAEEGVDAEVLRSHLRDMRYQQRQVRGGGMPDALSRMLNALPVLMYGGDVASGFDNSAALKQLEQQVSDPAYIKGLIRQLLDSPNRLQAKIVPDPEYTAKRSALEADQLAAQDGRLTEADRQRIREESDGLEPHRQAGSDNSVLPRIAPSDVGTEPRRLPEILKPRSDVLTIPVAANGITYASAFYDVSQMPASDWPWLDLYTDVVEDLGVRDLDHAAASAWRHGLVSSFSTGIDVVQLPGRRDLSIRVSYFASALCEDAENIAEVIRAWVQDLRFDELDRIGYLVKSGAEERRQGLTEDAGSFAAAAAAAPFSPRSRFEHEVNGLGSLAFWRRLRELVQTPEGVKDIAMKLEDIHRRVTVCPRSVMWSGRAQDIDGGVPDLLSESEEPAVEALVPPQHAVEVLKPPNVALLTPSQVNHCHIAWAAPGMHHPDAPALAVAAQLMSHQILHNRLREQGGAYGGSASYSAESEVFAMSSFRDPRLAGTYADFRAALQEVITGDFSRESVEEAIIAVVGRLDKPPAPYSEALEALKLMRLDVTAAARRQFRAGVLACTLEDIKRATNRWLIDTESSRAAAVGRAEEGLAGLDAVDLIAAAA